MKSFKKILFWVLFLPIVLIYLVVLLVGALCDALDELAHLWEHWCFDLKEDWDYVGDGIWRGRRDAEYLEAQRKKHNG